MYISIMQLCAFICYLTHIWTYLDMHMSIMQLWAYICYLTHMWTWTCPLCNFENLYVTWHICGHLYVYYATLSTYLAHIWTLKVFDSLQLKASIGGQEPCKVRTCCCRSRTQIGVRHHLRSWTPCHSRPLIGVRHHLRSLTPCHSRPQLEVTNHVRSRLVAATQGLW